MDENSLAKYLNLLPISLQVPPVQDEEENSFDPSEFFRHSSLADQVTDQAADQAAEGEEQPEVPTMVADINNDLAVSESDSDAEDEIDRNFDPLAGITSQEQSGGFDIDSFCS